MDTIRVRVENGKIVGKAPPGYEEGAVLELSLADSEDEMSETELARLNLSLEAAWRSVQAGEVRPAADVIDELRKDR